MKRNYLLLMLCFGLFLMSNGNNPQKYKIVSFEDIQLIRRGDTLLLTNDIQYLYATDTVLFVPGSVLRFQLPGAAPKRVSVEHTQGLYSIEELQYKEEKKSLFFKSLPLLFSNITGFWKETILQRNASDIKAVTDLESLLYGEKIKQDILSLFEHKNYRHEEQIHYSFHPSNSLLEITNQSREIIFVDVVRKNPGNILSIFSYHIDWISDKAILPGEKEVIWLPSVKSTDELALICLPFPLPLNKIMQFNFGEPTQELPGINTHKLLYLEGTEGEL